LRDGRLALNGTTTHGESYFLRGIGPRRWLMLLPRNFVLPEIVTPSWLNNILRHPRILGPEHVLNDVDAAIAEPNASAQNFHIDDDYLFSQRSFIYNGIGGHDLPSFAVTVLHPLLDLMTREHGPTEFCIGTTHLGGAEITSRELPIRNATLRKLLQTLFSPEGPEHPPSCQEGGALRLDTLRLGDVVLFDYQMVHRGGANKSPLTRAMLYTTYSRRWFKDKNFQERASSGEQLASNTEFVAGDGVNSLPPRLQSIYDDLTRSTRFAVVSTENHQDVVEACKNSHGASSIETFSSPLFPHDPSAQDTE